MKASFSSVTPLLPAGADLEAAVRFYTEHLGFALVWRADAMAGIERDGVAFNLVVNDEKTWADNASFSIGVSDLDALYAEYRGVRAKVGPLETKMWGRREFHLIAPSGVCFQFYQRSLSPAAASAPPAAESRED
ncbi:MAG TPA: VOC family protein [Rhodanobacteraceae bacterium]|nr:VOC family protein [Rhodanobacteraceae bacterium]